MAHFISSMNEISLPRRVYLQNKCHICDMVLSKSASLLNHLRTQHHVNMEKRKSSYRRPKDTHYQFVQDKSAGEVHNACPSCWFHSPKGDNDMYINHIQENHPHNMWSSMLTIDKDPNQEPSAYNPNDHQSNTSEQAAIFAAIDLLTNSFVKLFSTANY